MRAYVPSSRNGAYLDSVLYLSKLEPYRQANKMLGFVSNSTTNLRVPYNREHTRISSGLEA